MKKGSFSRARKSFSGEEDFFQDHFPGRPLVPETILIEMIAQAGGVLLGLEMDFKKEVILAKIAEARFAEAVSPPCTLVVEARIAEAREEGAWIEGTVLCGGKTAARTRLLLVTMEALDKEKGPVVFSDGFLKNLNVYEVVRQSEGLS
ncbi:MAG: hypothetical protein HYZ52_00935 [Candidatus Omnitrophica bacterium]|nr:hypothetical protein [Candidatus Omnitrophota bacterium]